MGSQDIGRSIAYQGNGSVASDPALPPRFPDRQAGQRRPGPRHLAKGAETEILSQAGAFQLAPANARQISSYQAQQDAPPGKSRQQGSYARTMLLVEWRADPQVIPLSGGQDRGHSFANASAARSHASHHHNNNVRIEHPLDGNALRRSFEPRRPADSFYQGLPVVRAGPPRRSPC